MTCLSQTTKMAKIFWVTTDLITLWSYCRP